MRRTTDIHALRQAVAALDASPTFADSKRISLGAARIDSVLNGGLCRGALHEIVPAGAIAIPAAIGFAVGISLRVEPSAAHGKKDSVQNRNGKVLWLRHAYSEVESGKLYPPGLLEIGQRPDQLLLIRMKKPAALLQSAVEAAACDALTAVIIEFFGNPSDLDLTATRKLSLAAEKSRIPIFCLRAIPKRGASAAMTRWEVAPILSRALQANAPGRAAFNLKLLRHRMGHNGLEWRVEWDRDEQRFTEAPVSGAVVSLPFHRQAAAPFGGPWREAG